MKRILIMFLFLFTCVLTGCMQEKAADKPGEPSAAAEEMAAEEAKAEETAEKNEGSKPAVRKAGERMVKTVNGIEYAFRWCPAGEFLMGSPEDEPGRYDNETQHSVTLTRGFWMLETEVTQAMWESVMGTSIRQQHDKANTSWSLYGEGSNYPMYYVSWEECRSFCEKLSEKLGLTVSLPTEAQWEYACRAGTTGAYAGNLGEMGWYDEDWGTGSTHPVGQKKPNAWGLYDMHGNVWEWCQDWYDEDYYTESPTSDPCNLNSSSGSDRVIRGGGWYGRARLCRSANRYGDTPDVGEDCLGFRIVLAAPAASISEPVPPPGPTEESTPETTQLSESSGSFHTAGERMVKTVDGIEYAFRWCPAGEFLMGSPEDEPDRDDDETQHRVTLTRGFWMLETEVTQAMWKRVMGTDPSSFKGAQNPVECVSWDDCQEFCRKLSSQLGLTVSLPTEAQWEYACRAGTTSAYSFGSSLNGREANCDGNHPYGTSMKGPYLKKTVPVKSYAPNAWGLYDMHGNVWEWCQDWYDEDYYAESPTSDPTGPSSGSYRVGRGSCWFSDAQYCRSAFRGRNMPDDRGRLFGFRPVLAAPAASISEPVPPPGPTEESTPETTQLSESSGSFHTAGERMVKTVDGIEYAFRWCPPGTFTMGSPSSEPDRERDETQHSVTLTRGFWMLETEVTQAMWESVMGTTLEEQAQKMLHDDTEYDFGGWIGKKTLRDLFGFQRDEDPAEILAGVGSDRPMYYVSWNECEEFCRKLSSKLGMTVSLPTEAQWEYACRAGTTGAYAGDLGEMGWYDEDLGTGSTHPVGQKKPNAWGLYDMHGNVCEWCQDRYDEDYYTESPTSDPCNLDSSSGSGRVSRGGGWGNDARYCRSADRGGDTPDVRFNFLGFRPVLASPAPEE